jgi:xanthine dehydrogenase accessory factor
MQTIPETACRLLKQGETFILATIVSHTGSTPRTAGSKMIVTADGRGIGTIGGGLLEAEAMARAAELIPTGKSAVMPFDLSSETVASMNMICGGQAEVLLDCVAPSETNRQVFEAWRRMLADHRRGCFLSVVRTAGDDLVDVAHALLGEAGDLRGAFPLSESARQRVLQASGTDTLQTLSFDEGFVVVEPAARVCRVHIFGAGHVAQPTARLAALVDFQVHVCDDRREFANRERFPEAHAIRVLEHFETSFDGSTLNADDFVVIVTRGHLHDQTVLAGALATGAGYIGMIGSRRKCDTIYGNLRKAGISQDAIDRVHAPIGLPIGAETPEEIAVSIVAELIAARAGMRL